MNVLEIIVLLIVVALMIEGFRLGFVKTVFSIIRMVIGFVLAGVVCSAIAGLLPETVRYVVPVTFLIVMGIVFAILAAVEHLLNLVKHIPIAREVNMLAGIAAGFLKGIVVCWVAFAVFAYFKDVSWGEQVLLWLEGSKALTFLNELNPIYLFF